MTILVFTDHFLEVIKKSNETPVKKFQFPQTSAQEIGWNTEPLVSVFTVVANFLNRGSN